MKLTAALALPATLFLTACDRGSKSAAAAPPAAASELAVKDTPLLPISKGDTWQYEVRLEIPAGVTAADAPAVDLKHPRTRTYLGKVVPGEGLPEVDCFEVVVPGSPTEREFVEIYDDRILMRGSLIIGPGDIKPMWLTTPVAFVMAGMKAGTTSPEIPLANGAASRRMQVIAREETEVPAGKFQCIRLLTTGKDGLFELRRTTWFAPGTGIVREEKTRYHESMLVFRESQVLIETTVKARGR